MALPSRNGTASAGSNPPILQNPTNPTISSSQGTSGGSSSAFGGIEDPQALEALSILISQLQRGETVGQQQQGERNNEITRTRELSRDYSKGAAFLDAENAVNQSLRKSMEANMPAIVKAIQGAGTSASSMQGLLAQRLATESAQAAGTLGAKQAVDYGNISASLAGVLEALTRTNDPGTDNLIKALGLMKVDKSSSVQTSQQSSQSSGGGGGGTFIANTGSTGDSSRGSSGDTGIGSGGGLWFGTNGGSFYGDSSSSSPDYWTAEGDRYSSGDAYYGYGGPSTDPVTGYNTGGSTFDPSSFTSAGGWGF